MKDIFKLIGVIFVFIIGAVLITNGVIDFYTYKKNVTKITTTYRADSSILKSDTIRTFIRVIK